MVLKIVTVTAYFWIELFDPFHFRLSSTRLVAGFAAIFALQFVMFYSRLRPPFRIVQKEGKYHWIRGFGQAYVDSLPSRQEVLERAWGELADKLNNIQ